MKILLTFKHCQKRKCHLTESFSITLQSPPKRLDSATSGTHTEGLSSNAGSWLNKKADEIQLYTVCKDMKTFYSALKTVCVPNTSGSPLLIADRNTLVTDKEKILDCQVEHFHSVLYQPSDIRDEAITISAFGSNQQHPGWMPSQAEVLTPFQHKYMQLLTHHSLGGPPRCTRWCWISKKYNKTLKMLQFFTSENEKETCGLLITTEAFLCFSLQRKSWPESCWTFWINTLSKTCCQIVIVASIRAVEW